MSLAGATLVLALFLVLLLGGCSSSGSGTTPVGHYLVRVPKTPMYRYGPAQSFGPDFSLAQGQHVIMLSREFGYSRVMTDDGQSGYVATEDLAVAPPPPAPPPPKKPSRGIFARRSGSRGSSGSDVSSANRQIMQSGPLFGTDELPPLPQADPLQPDKPGFRVNVPAPVPGENKSKPGFRVRVPEKKE